MTGMPAARAFSMPGLMASKSTAAMMIAAGLQLDHVVELVELRSGWFWASSETTS